MKIAVIGAGASGCMVALAASGKDNEVLLFDGNEKIGRKIYATGNGRCNLTNTRQSPYFYNSSSSPDKVRNILSRFSAEDIMNFFEESGILLHSRGDYIYPRTDQASTIARFFEMELDRSGVRFFPKTRVTKIEKRPDGIFRIYAGGKYTQADRVILSCGGLSGKKFGCTGDGYRFAEAFGHTVISPLPALTSLCACEKCIRRAAGVRCAASVTLMADGQAVRTEEGELQITKNALSGIVIFQLSRFVSAALAEGKDVCVRVDFLPDMQGQEERWELEKRRRLQGERNMTCADWMLGLANRGVTDMLLDSHGIASEKKAYRISDEMLSSIMDELRAFHFHITGTGGFDNAQATAGGVPLTELTDELESRMVPGLYITGEMADVDGLCGGYNLTWAFSTGHTAGMAAGNNRENDTNIADKTPVRA